VHDEHDAKEASPGLVVLVARFRNREVCQGERGAVEGDVAFGDERRVKLEREREEESDRVAVGRDRQDSGSRVDVALCVGSM